MKKGELIKEINKLKVILNKRYDEGENSMDLLYISQELDKLLVKFIIKYNKKSLPLI